MNDSPEPRPAPRESLPPFPVDPFTLKLVRQALHTVYGEVDPATGRRTRVGGEFTLTDLLDHLSGYDPSLDVKEPDSENIYVYPFQIYHRDSLIEALLDEVERLRDEQA